MSVVPNKAKQLLLILKGTRLFITEVIYLYGTRFRGILRKEGLVVGLFSYLIRFALSSPLQPSLALNGNASPAGALGRTD